MGTPITLERKHPWIVKCFTPKWCKKKNALLKINMSPKKETIPKGHLIFQPLFFRGYSLGFGGVTISFSSVVGRQRWNQRQMTCTTSTHQRCVGWELAEAIVNRWCPLFFWLILLMVRSKSGINSPVEVGRLSHYLQGFLHVGWLAGFLNHQQVWIQKVMKSL